MNSLTLPSVSVIIVNYNGKKFFEQCLKSVLDSNYPNFEVIIVDNASTDGSIELIERLYGQVSEVRIVRNRRNYGFPQGNNIGIKYARGQYLAFLNIDTVVDRDWMIELVKVLEGDVAIGAAQSKLLLLDNPRIFDSAGDFMDHYGRSIQRGEWKEIDKGQFDQVEEVFSARGAAMIVRRRVISEVGPFDPKFFLSCEDIDLCWRIRLRGNKIFYVPTSIVYHKGSGVSPLSSSPIKIFYNSRNAIMMLLKNYNLYNLLTKLSVFLLHIVLGMIHDLMVKRNVKVAIARFKAILQVIANLRYVWRERLRVQYCLRRVSDAKVMRYMLNTNPKLFTRLLIEVSSGDEARKATATRWYYLLGSTKYKRKA